MIIAPKGCFYDAFVQILFEAINFYCLLNTYPAARRSRTLHCVKYILFFVLNIPLLINYRCLLVLVLFIYFFCQKQDIPTPHKIQWSSIIHLPPLIHLFSRPVIKPTSFFFMCMLFCTSINMLKSHEITQVRVNSMTTKTPMTQYAQYSRIHRLRNNESLPAPPVTEPR